MATKFYMNRPTKIICHHTNGTVPNPNSDTSHHTADTIDAWHKIRWPGFTSKVFRNSKGGLYHVGYHFVIHANGDTIQTRGLGEEGAHCIGMNTSSIGVCFTGNFDVTYPTQAQIDAFAVLWKELKDQYPNLKTSDIVPHRTYSSKSCFGNNLPDNYFAGLVVEKMTSEEKANNVKDREELRELLKKYIAILMQMIAQKRMKL